MIRMEKDLIKGLVYTRFDEEVGPIPTAFEPQDLSRELTTMVSLKSTTLLAGEKGAVPSSLAILPIPSQGLKGLIKIVRIEDERFRGGANDASFTLLYKESADSIFYKYMNNMELFFDRAEKIIKKLEESRAELDVIQNAVTEIYNSFLNMLNELRENEINEEEEAFPFVEEKDAPLIRNKYKVIVVGNPAVGKTSTVLQFTDKAFKQTYMPTIGVNMSEKKFLHKGELFEFILWDVAGQAKFQRMRKLFYEGSNAQLLIFDLTKPESLKDILKWHQDIKSILKRDIPGFLIGNKSDLINKRNIKDEDIKRIAEELKLDHILTSAKTGENVDEAFFALADKIKAFYENNLFL